MIGISYLTAQGRNSGGRSRRHADIVSSSRYTFILLSLATKSLSIMETELYPPRLIHWSRVIESGTEAMSGRSDRRRVARSRDACSLRCTLVNFSFESCRCGCPGAGAGLYEEEGGGGGGMDICSGRGGGGGGGSWYRANLGLVSKTSRNCCLCCVYSS